MRRLRSALAVAGIAMLAAVAVTGCAAARGASSISVANAYVPQPTTPGTTVAYLDIRNNGAADRLVAAHTSVGGTVQLRAPAARHANTLLMRTVPDIPIPADSLTQLDPDSFHLRITGAGPMHDGKDIMLQLTFANAGTITVVATVTDPESGGSSYFINLSHAADGAPPRPAAGAAIAARLPGRGPGHRRGLGRRRWSAGRRTCC